MKKKILSCDHCESKIDSVFKCLDQEALSELSEEKRTNLYKKGQILFYEGNMPYGIFCISEGVIKLYKTSLEGKQTIVRMAKPGDILGYRSLFSSQPYNATGECLEDSRICFTEKKVIYKLITENPELALEIISKLSLQLGFAENMAHGMAYRSARERLAELILLLNESFGEEANGVRRINLKLTREEISQMIGTTQETVIRLMSEFKDDDMVDTIGKTMIIRNHSALLSAAHLEEY